MKVSLPLTVGLALLVSASAASAQTGQISLEGRGGFAVPQSELKDIGASTGLSVAADLMYNFSPRFTGYLGASRDGFGADISSTGVQAGLKIMPFGGDRVLPWVSAGLTGQSLEVGDVDSGMELGVEGGAGIDFMLSERFSLTPGVRFRSYDADFPTGATDARYFAFSLGAHFHIR